MTLRAFFIGVLLAVAATAEAMILLDQWDRRKAGLETVPRWRVAFGVAVILAAIAGTLRIGGYLP